MSDYVKDLMAEVKAKNPAERATYDANYRCEDNVALTYQALVDDNEDERKDSTKNLLEFTSGLHIQALEDDPSRHNFHCLSEVYVNIAKPQYDVGWHQISQDY